MIKGAEQGYLFDMIAFLGLKKCFFSKFSQFELYNARIKNRRNAFVTENTLAMQFA